MKHLKSFFTVLLFASAITMQAQNSWAMATIEEGRIWPSFTMFRCTAEKGANGTDYYRIYDWGFFIRKEYYNPTMLQYGYRVADKQIFVYDYDKNEECLAFDFTLAAGDRFITYNGMEWEVDAAVDTLVNLSYSSQTESCTKRLLRVHSVDGLYSDQWLEDFGSLANHLMIRPMSQNSCSQTLWMEYDYGYYLVRELSLDPLFTHDSGMPEDNHQHTHGTGHSEVTYSDGTLRVEREGFHSPNRQYTCYYRVDDDLYNAYTWDLNPATNAAYTVWHKEIAYFYGLPAPQSGEYTVHFLTGDLPTGIHDVEDSSIPVNSDQAKSSLFDLQGRRLSQKPARGVYIQGGMKRRVR